MIKLRKKQKQNKHRERLIAGVVAIILVLALILTSIAASRVPVYAAGASTTGTSTVKSKANKSGQKKATPTPTTMPKKEKKTLEKIMKGLSTFHYKAYEWAGLTVGGMPFALAEGIYNISDLNTDGTKTPIFWKNEDTESEMKDFYSSTNWNEFEGMYETVELSNSCEAVLSDEVAKYEDLMDKAAEDNGFKTYKEIFKAIAQARFNEHKDEYEAMKKDIKGEGSDKFDLFHINGSWLADTSNGDVTPVSSKANVSPKDEYGEDERLNLANKKKEAGKYTVQESIDAAAKAFANMVEEAVYPSPYNTDSLICVVQGFEFGGSSKAIKNQYNRSPLKLDEETGFVTFTDYCNNKASSSKNQSAEKEEVDYDSIIEAYAKVIAHGEERANADDENGKYKYSDQKFYQKVFENYKCSGGGSGNLDMGQLPDDMKEILKKCMATWDSKVTKERREIIQQGVMLYGVTYDMNARNSPSYESPKYLDCSSFVGQCYWRSGVAAKEGQSAADWATPSISSTFTEISESQLIPGDVGQKHWPGNAGGEDHVGIYIGTVNGTKYWLHCTGGYTDGIYHAPGKAIKINNYSGFAHFGRYPGL